MPTINNRFNSDTIRQGINLGAILAALGINVYTNINPPNGITIGEISNTTFRDVLITRLTMPLQFGD